MIEFILYLLVAAGIRTALFYADASIENIPAWAVAAAWPVILITAIVFVVICVVLVPLVVSAAVFKLAWEHFFLILRNEADHDTPALDFRPTPAQQKFGFGEAVLDVHRDVDGHLRTEDGWYVCAKCYESGMRNPFVGRSIESVSGHQNKHREEPRQQKVEFEGVVIDGLPFPELPEEERLYEMEMYAMSLSDLIEWVLKKIGATPAEIHRTGRMSASSVTGHLFEVLLNNYGGCGKAEVKKLLRGVGYVKED